MFKPKSNPIIGITVLAGAPTLFVLSGCKSPPPTEDTVMPETSQVDTGSNAVVEAPADNNAGSETLKNPDKRGKKMTKAETDVVVSKGPGDGPPPAAETKSKVEEMEKSLAPLQAVPAAPPS